MIYPPKTATLGAGRKFWLILAIAFLTPQLAIGSEPTLVGQGGSREGYADPEYRSDSRRVHAPAETLPEIEQKTLIGLPPMAHAPTEVAELGRKLFFDRRLAVNGTVSCAMCHVPEQAFAQNELQTPVGVEGRSVRRNAPTLLNVGYRKRLFHDGRENRLETQAWSPILNQQEMANPSVGFVLEKLAGLEDYDGLFEAAFARPATMETVGDALAAYQRTLTSAGSSFDRWYYGGEAQAINPSAKRGFELFQASSCADCHLIGKEFAQLTDDSFHDTGLGFERTMLADRSVERLTLAPGVTVETPSDTTSRPTSNDLGRYEITGDPADRWKYKTPTLRNIAFTAPYMHDGSLSTLDEVIRHYEKGGVPHPGQDPRIRPLDLTAGDIKDLVAFLGSLSGNNLDALVALARRPHSNSAH